MRKTIANPQNRIRKLECLIEATKLLNSTLDLDKILKILLELATKNLNAKRGTIYLVDEKRNELWSRVLKGNEIKEIRLPRGVGIAGHVWKTGETIIVRDAYQDPRFFRGIDEITGFRTKTMLCLPLRNKDGVIIGVFQILNKRTGVFGKDDGAFLEGLSAHAAIAIENARLHQEALEIERLEKELQIAAAIQKQLLPSVIPPIPGYQVSATALPCKEIGGDFFDVIKVGENKCALAIADVAGKSVPAAMLVSTLQAVLHAYLERDMPLVQLVEKLNKVVYFDSTPERYITFFIALLDCKHHLLTSVNAGHNFPYLFRSNGKFQRLEDGGLPLGMFETMGYRVQEIQVQPNDVLLMYTDGVTESMNKKRKQYGEKRFLNCVRQNLSRSAEEVQTAVCQDVQSFTENIPQWDDFTMLVMKRVE